MKTEKKKKKLRQRKNKNNNNEEEYFYNHLDNIKQKNKGKRKEIKKIAIMYWTQKVFDL